MPMKFGRCRLCLATTDLCASHVIPEFCYEGVYDEKHRPKLMQASPDAQRWVQKGLREHLLCAGCENTLSKTENWFKTFWYGAGGLQTSIPSELPEITVPDMQQFHLFHLTILWRASVASGKEWNTVALGPYEEKIRQILLAPARWKLRMYPVFVQTVVDEKHNVVFGAVGKPQRSRYDQSWVYYTLYSGAEFAVFVTEAPSPVQTKLMDNLYIGENRIRMVRRKFTCSGTAQTWARQRRG